MDNAALTVILPDGTPYEMYKPHRTGLLFHQNSTPNLIAVGNRGGGKSTILRNDAHIRALSVPGANLILVRKTYPDLLKTHIIFIKDEMKLLGGSYHSTDHVANYPNGSKLFLSHVSSEADALNLLSAEFLGAYFDELSVIPWEFFTKLCASVRVKSGLGLTAVVRAATNPLGPSADDIRRYFVDRDVEPADDPEYNPDDWGFVRVDRQDNPHIDQKQYVKRFAGMAAHVRRAWLDGEFSLENSLFELFPNKDDKPYHVIDRLEIDKIIKGGQIYRAYDHGYFPDPAICLWIAHLGSRYVVLRERLWTKTIASDIAQDIKEETDNLGITRVVATLCDPTLDIHTGADIRTIRDIFEECGVPMECSINNREMFASSVHTALAEEAEPGVPRIQFYKQGCPYLIKTIPLQQYNPKRPLAMADNRQDHGVCALAYFLMSHSSESHQAFPTPKNLRPWQKTKTDPKKYLGYNNVRERG